MILTLKRIQFGEDATIGNLYVDGELECDTLEDKVREDGEKVAGETAIPAGTYTVELTYSSKFKKTMPELKDVPNFSGIRIHSGNTADDTEGCILVGTWLDKNSYKLTNSRNAYNALYKQLEKAVTKGDTITIEIP